MIQGSLSPRDCDIQDLSRSRNVICKLGNGELSCGGDSIGKFVGLHNPINTTSSEVFLSTFGEQCAGENNVFTFSVYVQRSNTGAQKAE